MDEDNYTLEEKSLWFGYNCNPQTQTKWERPMTLDPRRNFNDNDNYNNYNNDHMISPPPVLTTAATTVETGAKNDNWNNTSSVIISNNLNNNFDELRSMTTGQIAHLCKLQQQQDRERRQQQQAQENHHQQQLNNEVVATINSNKPFDTYVPLHLSSMPLLSITQRAEPGRLDVRMHSLREELSKFGYQPS
mmetsp:Transcript_53788/g.60090  ORF Transcript_53788/g.60090 Transcript_53788/m.60090 type:complete len:191 (+) Transcript_53788:234-806(+)